MAEPFLSEIRMFAFGDSPEGWVRCNGQLLSIAANRALFSLIGNAYGGSEAQGTFAVPDLRDRLPLGAAPDLPLGQPGGAVEHALTGDEMPGHDHALFVIDDEPPSDGNLPRPTSLLSESRPALYRDGGPPAALHPDAIDSAGAGAPHTNEQPYVTVAFYMATFGLFPSRG